MELRLRICSVYSPKELYRSIAGTPTKDLLSLIPKGTVDLKVEFFLRISLSLRYPKEFIRSHAVPVAQRNSIDLMLELRLRTSCSVYHPKVQTEDPKGVRQSLVVAGYDFSESGV